MCLVRPCCLAFERVSEASARWYRAAWEKDPPTDQQAREQRRFECVWNGLVARGVDPVPDLHCLARAMTATAECQEGGKPAGKCSHVFGETCMFSSHYEEVTASCSKDGG